MQSLLHLLNANQTTIGLYLRTARRFSTVTEANDILRNIELNDTMSHKYVLLECGPLVARAIIVGHVQDILMSRRNYHFLLPSLVMDDYFDQEQTPEFAALNITGFRMERNIAAKLDLKQLNNFIRSYPSQYYIPPARTANGNSRTASNLNNNLEPVLSVSVTVQYGCITAINYVLTLIYQSYLVCSLTPLLCLTLSNCWPIHFHSGTI